MEEEAGIISASLDQMVEPFTKIRGMRRGH